MNTLDVVAGIIESDGKLLLACRPPQGDQAGLWEFPGGKVESGESQPAALRRELKEELGIDAQVGEYIASHTHSVAGRVIRLHAWHVPEFHGDPQPLCHSALVWCLPGQVRQYALAPADIPLLAAFRDLRAATSTD